MDTVALLNVLSIAGIIFLHLKLLRRVERLESGLNTAFDRVDLLVQSHIRNGSPNRFDL